jgi:hypothetical protein
MQAFAILVVQVYQGISRRQSAILFVSAMGGEGDDFATLGAAPSVLAADEGEKKKKHGVKRAWLMAFETLPAQLLNVYGTSVFPTLKDDDVWKHFNEPQKTGAIFMTEYCSVEVERRGIAVNRWLHAQMLFCKYQEQPSVKNQNQFVLNVSIFTELYEEIARILPSLEICLAPRKEFEKKAGAASLRSGGVSGLVSKASSPAPALLDQHAKILWDWIDKESQSRIRMLQNFQAAGGISFVASVHHRATRCFRYVGNSIHTPDSPEVTLSTFQECIKSRHLSGSRGMEYDTADTGTKDYAAKLGG